MQTLRSANQIPFYGGHEVVSEKNKKERWLTFGKNLKLLKSCIHCNSSEMTKWGSSLPPPQIVLVFYNLENWCLAKEDGATNLLLYQQAQSAHPDGSLAAAALGSTLHNTTQQHNTLLPVSYRCSWTHSWQTSLRAVAWPWAAQLGTRTCCWVMSPSVGWLL